jgi:AcrR family transcriptional regulator
MRTDRVDKPKPPSATGKAISQKRSRKTYDKLIATGFKLLERHEFDSITIADLAGSAGYSVGAFYARFRSKDEFFDALVAHHMQHRREARERLLRKLSDAELIPGLISDLVTYYWKRRWFWRAALIRSIRDPQPLRRHADEFATALIARLGERHGRPLNAEKERNVRHALQITLGTINNAIIYGDGPAFRGKEQFIENLVNAFRLISGYDDF